MQEASQAEPSGIAPLPPRPRHHRIAAVRLLGVAVVLVGGIAAGVALGQESAPRPPFYAGMPAPCTMVPQPADRIPNMAEPSGGLVQTSGPKQTGTCDWVGSTGKGNQEMLQLEIDLYRSAGQARQAYDFDTADVYGTWAPPGVTQSPWAVPGLGDQAAGQLVAGMPEAGDTTVAVWVQSGNAVVWISLYSGDWGPSTGDHVEIQSVTAMADHILAVLRKGRPA